MTDHSVHAPCPRCNRLQAYIAQAFASFEKDPADTDYQEGYKAALIVIRDEAFTSNDVVPCPLDPFDLCVMIVEEECWLDMPESAFHRPIGHSIRNRIRCAQRDRQSPDNEAPSRYQEGFVAGYRKAQEDLGVDPADQAASYKVTEVENYRLALAWISMQSVDPKSRELASEALEAFEDSVPSTEHSPPGETK